MNVKKKIALLWFALGSVVALPNSAFGQLNTYEFEQIDSLQKLEARPLVVFIYTDWCRYCLAMENSTLKVKNIVKKLNAHFYFVALNAEEKRTISFHGTIFKYQATGNGTGIHELALALSKENEPISYPSLCILNSDFEIVFQNGNFMGVKEMERVLDQIFTNLNTTPSN